MYVPADFSEPNPTLRELIVQHPFGSLITHGKSEPTRITSRSSCCRATAARRTACARLARESGLAGRRERRRSARDLPRGRRVYLADRYPSKHVAHRQVPTWNYVVVHAHGRITVRDDAKFVRGVVAG